MKRFVIHDHVLDKSVKRIDFLKNLEREVCRRFLELRLQASEEVHEEDIYDCCSLRIPKFFSGTRKFRRDFSQDYPFIYLVQEDSYKEILITLQKIFPQHLTYKIEEVMNQNQLTL
jgi:hypothetical protein